jgi:hypothetical protein
MCGGFGEVGECTATLFRSAPSKTVFVFVFVFVFVVVLDGGVCGSGFVIANSLVLAGGGASTKRVDFPCNKH